MANLQEFCLRWNNHNSVLTGVFAELLKCETFFDCTLVSAEGRSLEVHRILLSACSPYFRDVLSQHKKKEPIIILKDVKFRELSVLVDYMYYGEVNIRENELQDILKVAESLRIKGLSDTGENAPPPDDTRPLKRSVQSTPTVPHSSYSTEHGQSYQSDLHSNDSSMHSDDSPAPAKRGRRRRPSNESGHLHSQTPSESPINVASPHPAPSAISHLPHVPALSTTAVNPLSTPALDVPVKILPDSAQSASKTELIEPKQEIEEVNGDDDYEDLTQEDDSMNMDNSQPGPSQGNDSSSSQGFPPWQLGTEGGANQDSLLTQAAAGGSQGVDIANNFSGNFLDYVVTTDSSLAEDGLTTQSSPSANSSKYFTKVFSSFPEVASSNFSSKFSSCIERTWPSNIKLLEDSSPQVELPIDWALNIKIDVEGDALHPFCCYKCGNRYTSKGNLKKHLIQECGRLPRFQCPFCPHKTKRNENLKRHIKQIHKAGETLDNSA